MAGETPTPKPAVYKDTVVIGPEYIDRNRHVNNAAYQAIYQQQRDLWFEDNKVMVPKVTGFKPIVFSGAYARQVYEGDEVEVETLGETLGQGMKFLQTMSRNGDSDGEKVLLGRLTYDISGRRAIQPENLPPPLFEYPGEVVVSSRATTENGELNISYFFEEWENQRTGYLESLGVTADALEDQMGLLFVLARYYGSFSDAAIPEQSLTMHTSIQNSRQMDRAMLLFRQRITQNEQEMASFTCSIYTFDKAAGRTVDIPSEIISAVDLRNTL